MNTPTFRFAEHLQDWSEQTHVKDRWYLARPFGLQGMFLKLRLKAAWMVFTGKADVLLWMQDYPKPPTGEGE